MTTSNSSGLSADAKEFVPFLPNPPANTIPLYIDENTIASVYTIAPQEPSQLIYPSMSEIEFRLPPSTNENLSPLILLPTNGCYPGTGIPNFYPVEYPEPSLIGYSLPQSKSNSSSTFRPQRGSNHSNSRNPHPTNPKRASRIIQTRFPAQKKENCVDINENDSNAFKLRTEDFPSLSIPPSSHLEKSPTPLPASTETKLVEILSFKFIYQHQSILLDRYLLGTLLFLAHDLNPHLHLVLNDPIKVSHQQRNHRNQHLHNLRPTKQHPRKLKTN